MVTTSLFRSRELRIQFLAFRVLRRDDFLEFLNLLLLQTVGLAKDIDFRLQHRNDFILGFGFGISLQALVAACVYSVKEIGTER